MSEFNAFETPDPVTLVDSVGIDCVLAAGDESEAREISEWLQNLPEDAYGAVFIEGASVDAAAMSGADAQPVINAPAGVMVTRLTRASDASRGDMLSAAVSAWLDEWLWADSQNVRNFELFTSQGVCPRMQTFWSQLDARLAKRWPGCSQTACPIRDLGCQAPE